MAQLDLIAQRLAKASQRQRQDPNAQTSVNLGYEQWLSNRKPGSWLPRPSQDFTDGQFGPLAPIRPYPVNKPHPDENLDRPRPRRWQYPVGYDLPSTPGLTKLVNFANLRAYADLYSVARTCIELRKKEVIGLGFDILPTDDAHEVLRGDRAALDDWKERRNKALAFWRRPDPGNFDNFSTWMFKLLEDLLVVDAMTVYLHPTRKTGKGPFGSDLAALEVIDGTTILPLVDLYGASPRPPAPAYQQYLYGVPRVELTNILVQDGDDSQKQRLKEFGEPASEYRGDQLLYMPYVARSWTMYGFPPVEQGILPIITGLKRQQFREQFFTEGSVPHTWLVGPPEFTAMQLQQLQDAQNIMAGNMANKWRVRTLPHGAEVVPVKNPEIAGREDYPLWLEVLSVFDVKPMEVGFSPGGASSRGAGGSGGAIEGQERASQRHSLLPLVHWLEDTLFNVIIQKIWKQEDMRFVFTGLDVKDDEQSKAMVLGTYVSKGIMTIDEARADIDLEPYGVQITSEPIVVTANGVVPVFPETAAAMLLNSSLIENGAEQLTGTPGGGSPPTTAPAGTPNKPTSSEPARGRASVSLTSAQGVAAAIRRPNRLNALQKPQKESESGRPSKPLPAEVPGNKSVESEATEVSDSDNEQHTDNVRANVFSELNQLKHFLAKRRT